MKKRNLTAAICSGILILTTSQAAVAHPDIASISPTVSVDMNETKEHAHDLFRAIMFFQGPYADEMLDLEVFASLDAELQDDMIAAGQKPGSIDVVDSLINEIEERNPEFFADFARDVQSGTPSRVDAALESAMVQIESTEEFKESIEEAIEAGTYVPGESGVTCGVAVVVGAAAVIAVTAIVVGNFAVMVNVAGGGNVAHAVNWTSNRSTLGTGPAGEAALIRDIAKQYASK